MKKKILIGLLIVFIVIQFVRPTRNVSSGANDKEISMSYRVPLEVQAILQHSCYDCHSNHTVYPWYSNIQPVGWWIQGDINNARRHLNFSEFGTYPAAKAKNKFEDIEDAATNGWMPLASYVWLHKDARLTPDQAKTVALWAAELK